MLVSKAIWWIQDYLWAGMVWLSTVGAPQEPTRYAEGGRDVVVVPGVYENWQFMRPLIVPLHRVGYAIHTVPGLGHNRVPIATGAHALLRMLADRDLRDVVIVGHSKGGLIGKLAMMADQDGRIDHLVTLCTPFHGSSRSRLLPLRSLRPLAPGHPTLASLSQAHPVNAKIISIGSRYDEQVPEGSELPGAHSIRLKVPGHFRPLGHPEGVAAVIRAIEQSPHDARAGADHPIETGLGSRSPRGRKVRPG